VDARSVGSPWLRRVSWLALSLLAGGALASGLSRSDTEPEASPPASSPSRPEAPPAPSELEPEARRLTLPRGAAPRISCAEAQRATLFLGRELAAPPIAPTPGELAELWAGLMDPHGLWSAAPDSPLVSELTQAAPDMLRSLHEGLADCAAADRVGAAFRAWLGELAPLYDAAFDAARTEPAPTPRELFEVTAEPIFEDDPVTRPGRELARQLGRRLGRFAARFPEEHALIEQARSRFLPNEPEELAEIATLAALRAYVPLVDPHGDFAGLDEEWALYAGDSTLDGGSPLWGDVTRTPLGARVTSDPAPPLELDDVVLAIGALSLAGASIDQIEQAARSGAEHDILRLRVLRQGELHQLEVDVGAPLEAPVMALELERIRYRRDAQPILRIVIPDVADGLGQSLAEVLAREAAGSSALLLDLRGNGGGSLDAAVESLGLFVPGARLFSLVHRGYVTEVLQAPLVEQPYLGPVAALVDGDTASAAEMLAGALQAYERGMVIGARTFGKGCVQEYFDDVAPSGVLRMTTLQFVLPNGRPLQQIGLTPDVTLPLAPALERESQIARQPITFDGPDVRDRDVRPGPIWPIASTAPGPCRDPLVCTAISRLASASRERNRRPSTREGAPVLRDSGGARATRPRAGTR
jgi:carboxyl-terminal processing protease